MKKIKIIVFLVSALLCANVFGQDADTISPLLSRAKAGDALAKYELGLLYLAEGEEQNISQAVLWLREAAEAGVAGAQYDLGIAYQYGDAIPEDANEAVKWWRKAAEQGHPKALFNMGWCYLNEYGVPRDEQQAKQWIRKAAASGCGEAIRYIVEEEVTQLEEEFLSSLRHVAEAGDVIMQYLLGLCYLSEGEEQDLSQAVLWLLKAAEAGVADAQYNLGVAYQYGDAIPEDANEAVKWWRKAAEQGHPKALFNMGWCYLYEYGVPFNSDEGIKYFRCAAAQGDEGALEYILNQIMARFPMKLD